MSQNKTIVTVVAVAAVAAVGYAAWASYANKKVREVADNSLARVEKWLESPGKDVSTSYDDVTVHSFSLRPRASMHNLRIVVKEPMRRREIEAVLPEVVYTPQSFNMRSYTLEIVDSVTLTAKERGDTEVTLMDFSSAPALQVRESVSGDVRYALDIPQHISLAEVDGDEDPATAEKTDITFKQQPKVEWAINKNGISTGYAAAFPSIEVTYDSEALVNINGLTMESRYSDLGDGQHQYVTLGKLESLEFAPEELAVLNPISIINDFTYTGPVAPDGAVLDENAPQHLQLKNIALMTGMMSVFANGDVHFIPTEEKLPYGSLSLRFDNVDGFIAYIESQRPKTKAFLTAVRDALEKLSGAELEQGGEVTVTISRQPNERLYIGALTLEESFALGITLLMQLPDFSKDEDDVAPVAPQPAQDDDAELSSDADVDEEDDADSDDVDEDDSDAEDDAELDAEEVEAIMAPAA